MDKYIITIDIDHLLRKKEAPIPCVYQYDKGVVLRFVPGHRLGFDSNTELHVSTDAESTAKRYPVTLLDDGSCEVAPGDSWFFTEGSLYLWLYNIKTEYERTEARIRIPIKFRPDYEPFPSTPGERDETNAILISIRAARDEAVEAADRAEEAAERVPTVRQERVTDGVEITITDSTGTTTKATVKDGLTGPFVMSVDNGDLYVEYPDSYDRPNFEYDTETGDLYLNTEAE